VTSESAASLNDRAVGLQAEGRWLEADDLYKQSLAIWESQLGPEDLLVAQSLANRAALYRAMGEHHEAERIFQLAQRIWAKRDFPSRYDQPLWSDQLDQNRMLRNFGAYVRNLRARVEQKDVAAQD